MTDRDAARFEQSQLCSGWFRAGEIAALGLGAARLAYAGAARGASLLFARQGATLAAATAAVAFRNGLKKIFRINPFSKFRIYSVDDLMQTGKYRGYDDLIQASGRTDATVNALGAVGAAGGANALRDNSSSCGC